MIIIALNNQSWLDLALQYLGDAGQAYPCAMLNNCLESDAPPVGAPLTFPDTIIDQSIVSYYQNNGIVPACKYQGNNTGGFLLQANGNYILQANDGRIGID